MGAIADRVGQLRLMVGLQRDLASDHIWEERIANGTATFEEAERRIEAKARDKGVFGPGTAPYLGGGAERPVVGGGAMRQPTQPEQPSINFRDFAPSWLSGPLLDVYVDAWADTGDPRLALEAVRRSDTYEQTFPGIKRDDGSLRLSEQEYFSHREAFRREFARHALNPDLYESHHVELIEGEVSPGEFRQRLEAKIQGVQQNLPQVRQAFGQFYGIDAMDDRALIGAALDPDVGLQLMQGRITASQIAGEAAVQGFMRSRERSERLGNVGGLDQLRARELFSQASRAVPRFDRFARRFNEQDDFGVEEFEDAAVFGDAAEQRRMQRLQASERSMFNQRGTIREDQTGLTGLGRR